VDDRELQREVVEFTISFEPYVSTLVDAIVASQQEAEADRTADHDAQAVAAARDATAVGVATALSVIRVPHELPPALPAATLRNVRHGVRRGRSAEQAMQAYRLAHATFQDHVFRHAERTGASLAAVRRITESLFAYYDWAMPVVAAEYAREQADAPVEGGDPARYERVQRALAGSPPGDLDYPLDQLHVAVALDAMDGARIVDDAGTALGLATLSALTPDGRVWGWLGGAGLTAAAVAGELEERIGAGHAGVSEPEGGVHGFAGAHRKALIALRVGLLRDTQVSAYRDVALEALAFGGEEIAVDFARAELGRMAESTRRVAILRETLNEYFARGGSTAATARALAIAERTVTYRLRRAEELIGRPVSERRADLETALRLYDVLDIV
jgi:PucR-like helix-turn-helix protein/diguanylate cyclase with GGDEF domain